MLRLQYGYRKETDSLDHHWCVSRQQAEWILLVKLCYDAGCVWRLRYFFRNSDIFPKLWYFGETRLFSETLIFFDQCLNFTSKIDLTPRKENKIENLVETSQRRLSYDTKNFKHNVKRWLISTISYFKFQFPERNIFRFQKLSSKIRPEKYSFSLVVILR